MSSDNLRHHKTMWPPWVEKGHTFWMNPFRNRLVDPLGSSGLIPLAGYKMLWQREVDRYIITIALM